MPGEKTHLRFDGRDQELRFTVHDSPDYNKLKCSVFNDDRKTDLIGEAWIDLTAVVVPGGGQNDLWHQLQFRGKYAGDIRMELTYYDTRPKDTALAEKRPDKEQTEPGRQDSSSSDVGQRRLGPREVKRRPLPTDPVMLASGARPSPPEQIPSAPLSQNHQNDTLYDSHQEYDDQWVPQPHHHIPNNVEGPSYPELSFDERFDSESPASYNVYRQPQEATNSDFSHQSPSSYANQLHSGEIPNSDGFGFPPAQPSFPVTPEQSTCHSSFAVEPHLNARSSDPAPNRSSTYPVPTPYGSSPPPFNHDRSTPGSGDHQSQSSFRRYSTSPIKNDVFRDSPLRHSISQHDVEQSFQEQYDVSEDEGPPPPPPAHRSNLQASATPPDATQMMQPVQIPHPLNLVSNGRRMSPFDRSPLQSIERNYEPDFHNSPLSLQLSAETNQTYPAYSKPIYSAAIPAGGSNSYKRPGSGIENTPPSLRSGYGRGMEEIEDSWMQTERQVQRQSIVLAESPRSQDMNLPENGYRPYQQPRVEDEQQGLSSEAPFVNHRAVSPDPRIVPKRKAVSPQPLSNQGERGLSVVPFGPDSYEVFNPSSPLSSSVAGPESRYETPEQSKEAARQHEVHKLRDQGPIIGNDGRVIDPTDHLPTDTWAPEPERKIRKPEVVIRYKTKEPTPRTPQGYGSSPGLARPHSITGPVYGSSPLAQKTPPSLPQQRDSRNRLQKQMPGRPLPVQPYQAAHSSPAVPSAICNTPSPRSSYSSRPDLSEYSLYGQQSPSNGRGGNMGSPYDAAPPIPAKVPMSLASANDRYAGYGGMDALSAELSTIDIGTGVGGRGGRTRRGY